MLLSRHVPDHLSSKEPNQITHCDGVFLGRIDTHYSLTSVEQYIAERDSKRETIASIPKHRTFNPGDQGIVQFVASGKSMMSFLLF